MEEQLETACAWHYEFHAASVYHGRKDPRHGIGECKRIPGRHDLADAEAF